MNKNIMAVIAIVGVLIVGGLLYMLMNNDDNSDTTNTTTMSSTEQKSGATMSEPTTANAKDIVALASGTDSLSTLVTAVQAADLVTTLQSEGPFTVFAPTNDAFEALPAGTLDTLLKPENKQQLSSILTYHVVSGKAMYSDLSDGMQLTTVSGGKLNVEITDGKVYIVDAKGMKAMVVSADIAASNGVVHVIDNVLMPQ